MKILTLALVQVVLVCQAGAQNAPAWSEPFPPHRIADNFYFVGTRGLASYLITTPQGHILINAGLEDSVPLIEASVTKLGFRFRDVKILLLSHSHWDHVAGAALLKQRTGAKLAVMEPDVAVTEDGGKSDFFYGKFAGALFSPAKVDRILRDGDQVKLGPAVLTANLTPGHTKGCTTWTLKVADHGKTFDTVIIGSPNVNRGFRLVNNSAYPQIAKDYQSTFERLKSLRCDIFLGAHGDYYGLEAKFPKLSPEGKNVFVDPDGYRNYVAEKEAAFLREWNRQKSANP